MTTKEGDSKRLEAAKLFAQGYGYKAVSTELGINRETVRDRQNGLGVVEVMEKYQIQNRNRLKDWCKAYKEHGENAFL